MIQNTYGFVRFAGKLRLFGAVFAAWAVSFAADANAQTYYGNSATTQTTYTASVATTTNPTNNIQPLVSNGLAQWKASRAASMGLRGHLGGGLGQASYEAVGWSNQSSQAAIQNCCYWGTRPVSQIGVSRSADGFWYACVLYR